MAKGLKIAHENFAGTFPDRSPASLHDQSISSTVANLGGVGGIPQWVTVDGVKTIDVQFRDANGILHANAYIVRQKGSKSFLCANAVGAVESLTHSNASVTTCVLTAGTDAANLVAATGSSVCTIIGYDTSNTAFYASRITNKYVYDQSNNKYSYRTDVVANATYANVIVH
jgi:hypothetical protein